MDKIKDLLGEIEYYESIGKYKLADEITKRLIKLSYNASPSDLGLGLGEGTKWTQFRELIMSGMSLPGCYDFFFSQGNLVVTPDVKDCIFGLRQGERLPGQDTVCPPPPTDQNSLYNNIVVCRGMAQNPNQINVDSLYQSAIKCQEAVAEKMKNSTNQPQSQVVTTQPKPSNLPIQPQQPAQTM